MSNSPGELTPSSTLIVGIIGGLGQFGRWFDARLSASGCTVLICDLTTEITVEQIANQANVVIIAAPMSSTGTILERIIPLLKGDQLLVDLSSAKAPFLDLLASAVCEVLSLHPLFAPQSASSENALCVTVEHRIGSLGSRFLALLNEWGLNLIAMNAEEHDKQMAFVQGLIHFQLITAALCIADSACEVELNPHLATPLSRLATAMMQRVLTQNPRLYAEIQIYNPFVKETLRRLRKEVETVHNLIERGDVDALTSEISRAWKA